MIELHLDEAAGRARESEIQRSGAALAMTYAHEVNHAYDINALSAVLAVGSATVTSSAFASDESKSETEKNEKTIQLKDLPAPARDTVLRESKGKKLVEVEEMTKNGATVYEAVIKQGKKETGVVVDSKGKVLDRHSEKSEKGE